MGLELNKGLAASAVAALAITGLAVAVPAGPASAAGEAVVLLSLFNAGHDATSRFDGNDTAITLTAEKLDPTAVITFEYNTDPSATEATSGWTAIAAGQSLTGDFVRITWTPDPTIIGTTVAVRAVADVSGTKTYSMRQGVAIDDPASGPNSVGFFGGFPVTVDATQQGFFDQPYASTNHTGTHAAVTAWTSATSGTGQLSWWRPSDRTFQGTVSAQVEQTSLKAPGPTIVPGGLFHGDLDLTAFDADAGDVVAVGAELDTDDVLPMTLYAQQVTTVDWSEDDPSGPGQPATVTIDVLDQSSPGRPVAGAEVRRLSDGSLVGYTDGSGEVTASLFGGQTETYYVNTTDADGYDPAIDKSTGEVVPYTQVATGLEARSTDGPAFDDDEYAAGDLRLQLLDQFAVPMAASGQDVSYRLYPTGGTPPASYTTTQTDAQGRVTVPFDPAGPDGGYTLDFHLGANPDTTYTFTAGDSQLTLAPTAGASSPGGQISFTATLRVGGQPMPGRRVAVVYDQGIELVPGHVADAALLGPSPVPSLSLTTDAQGRVAFVVDDPAEHPQGAETGGTLALSTQAATGGVTGNPKESADGTTAFGSTKGKARIRLKGSSVGGKDRLLVTGPDSVAGETVKYFRVVGGKLELIKSRHLGRKGDTALRVPDTNGADLTTYVVKLVASDRVKASKSNKVRLE